MYHIAICDKDKQFIEYMKTIFNKSGADKSQTYFYEFHSGEQLLKKVNGPIPYNLLILNVELPGIDGYETAKHFRKKYPEAVLVFCSDEQMPAPEAFKVNTYRYLLKNESENSMLEEAKEILEEVDRTLTLPALMGHRRFDIVKVMLENILYIENVKRGSRIILVPNCRERAFGEQILLNDKLHVLIEKIEKFGFAFAHNSYVVNLNHVDMIQLHELVLDNGDRLSISDLYYRRFRESFTNHIQNKYRGE